MAKIRNLTADARSLFSADAPPIHPAGCTCGIEDCNVVELSDTNFVDRAWPKETWELVEPPQLESYVDASLEDAYLWVAGEPDTDDDTEDDLDDQDELYDPTVHTVDEVVAVLQETADADERARIIAAEAAGKARKGITEWSDR